MATMHKYTKDQVAMIRADIKALGIKANVKLCNWSIRIVLPRFTPEDKEKLRQYLISTGNGNSISGDIKNDFDWDITWSLYNGRGQIFIYNMKRG